MASLIFFASTLKNKIMKIEHKKIFCGPSKILKIISWPINICLKFHDPHKNPPKNRWHIFKKAKIFRNYFKHFWILPCVKNCRILICLWKCVFINGTIIFLAQDNKVTVRLLFLLYIPFTRKSKVSLAKCYHFNRYNLIKSILIQKCQQKSTQLNMGQRKSIAV